MRRPCCWPGPFGVDCGALMAIGVERTDHLIVGIELVVAPKRFLPKLLLAEARAERFSLLLIPNRNGQCPLVCLGRHAEE